MFASALLICCSLFLVYSPRSLSARRCHGFAAFVSPLRDVRFERGKTTGASAVTETGADFCTDGVLGALRGATRLQRLSVAGMCEWSDDALAALLRCVGGALEELDLGRCKQVCAR